MKHTIIYKLAYSRGYWAGFKESKPRIAAKISRYRIAIGILTVALGIAVACR